MHCYAKAPKAGQPIKSASPARPRPARSGRELRAGIGLGAFGRDLSGIPVRPPVSSSPQATLSGKAGATSTDERSITDMGGNGGSKTPPTGPSPQVQPVQQVEPPAPPKLTKKTQSGPTAYTCGRYQWVIQWELDKNTTKGGWIVQKVELPYEVKTCDDKPADPTKVGGPQPPLYPYWEAWQVNKDQKVTTYAEEGDFEDDTYSSAGTGEGTKGTFGLTGSAEYYDGLILPPAFKPTNKPPSGILPVTKSAPALAGGTGAIAHNAKVTFDCCSKDKTTKLTTV